MKETYDAGNVKGIFFEESLLVFEAQDLNLEQYMKASGAIQNAIQCYHVIYEKRKRDKKKNHYSDIRVGSSRKLSPEEFMLLNCGVGEDS